MRKEQRDLSVRESATLSLICVPLTIGLFFLFGHFEGVWGTTWVWWPLLLVFILSVVGSITGVSSLIWRPIGPTVRRIGRTTNPVFDRVLEWIAKLIVYGFVAVLLFLTVGDVFDTLGNLSDREFITMLVAGVAVCYFFSRNRE